jgi:hypothetical protein
MTFFYWSLAVAAALITLAFIIEDVRFRKRNSGKISKLKFFGRFFDDFMNVCAGSTSGLKVKNAQRSVVLLSVYYIILALSLFSPKSSRSFNEISFYKLTMISMITCLHACFLIGGFANYLTSGNPRYILLLIAVCVFMCFPASVGTVLGLLQITHVGFKSGLPLFTSAAILLCLCTSCARQCYVAWSASSRDPPLEYPQLCNDEDVRVNQSVQRVATYLQAHFPALPASASVLNPAANLRPLPPMWGLPLWRDVAGDVVLAKVRARLQLSLLAELVCTCAFTCAYAYERGLSLRLARPHIDFPVFVYGLVHSANMAIHLGYLFTNYLFPLITSTTSSFL